MQYFGYLRREPDDSPDPDFTGYDFRLGKLNQFNGNFIAAEMSRRSPLPKSTGRGSGSSDEALTRR